MRKKEIGFTLVEITISLLVLAIGLVGILSLFPVGFDASGRAANITEATLLAQGLIDDLRRDGYSAALGRNGENAAFVNLPNYEYEITAIDGIPDPPNPNRFIGSLCEVIVRVYWPADAGGPGDRSGQKNVELSVYLAKYEP